jgi:hypothetical protein
MAQRQSAQFDRLADLLATLSTEDQATLALAMRVAAPIVGRLIRRAEAISGKAET